MTRLILGSQSPRRKEILSHFSLPFEQISPNYDEDILPFTGDPSYYVCELAAGKALSLASTFPDDIILTADTIVWKDGKIYGKPKNSQDAFEILTELSGAWHSVFTGVVVHYQGRILKKHEETRVLFNELSPEQIRHYHNKLHWADKAGGYAIQMAGGLAIKKIDGCYYNVMGLPINTVQYLLKEVEIDLWEHIK